MMIACIKPLLLSLLCALLLGGMSGFSKEQIQLNRQQYAEQTLREMIARQVAHESGPGKVRLVEDGPHYLVMDNNHPAGRIRRQETTRGYNGRIGFWVAVNQEGEIWNVRVFEHRETPGIGDRIDHHLANWINIFRGLSLANTAPDHWAVRQDGGRFDGITGATVTSRAMIQAVHTALQQDALPLAPLPPQQKAPDAGPQPTQIIHAARPE